MTLKDFSNAYCPHCSAPLGVSQSYRPEECPLCKGMIGYDEHGWPRKRKWKRMELPLGLQDALVVLLVLVAIAVFIAYIWIWR